MASRTRTHTKMNSGTSKVSHININPDIVDSYYRYKMPSLDCKQEGRGGNKNTKILNLDKVAMSLSRPTEHLSHWLKMQLKTSITIIANTTSNTNNSANSNTSHRDIYSSNSGNSGASQQYKLKGHIETKRLQNCIFDFIKEWVLCQTCHNPETDIVRSTAGTRLKIGCKACGAIIKVKQRTYSGCIPYFQYLLKECPESSQDSAGIYGDSTKIGSYNASATIDTIVEGIFSPRPDIPGALHRSNSLDNGDDDEEWSLDISPEAVAARQTEVSRSIDLADMVINDNDKEEATRLKSKQLTAAEKKRIEVAKLCDLLEYTKSSWPIKCGDFRIKFVSLSLDEKRTCMILPYLLNGSNISSDLDKYMKLMEYMLVGKDDNQYYFLRELSRHLEILLDEDPERNNTPPVITHKGICCMLVKLYEEDLIDDKSYQRWYSRGMDKHVRSPEFATRLKEYIQPFHEWMMQEEEDDSDDDSDKEDSAVVVFNSDTLDTIASICDDVGYISINNYKEEDNEDDVDIDAI